MTVVLQRRQRPGLAHHVHDVGRELGGVWHVTAGLPYLIRLAGYGIRAPKNPVPGSDLAGVVEAVGTSVT